MSKNTRTRILLVAVAALLLVTLTVGGTLAWLTAVTTPVVNTFDPATITVNVDEHKYNSADNTLGAEIVKENADYLIVPGRDLKKDPMVDASSDVPFYVFVTIKTEDWLDALTYDVDSTWAKLEDGVYYQTINTANGEGKYVLTDSYVLKDNIVTVAGTLEKETMAGHSPKMTINAYAIQVEGTGTVAEAWAKVKPAT